METYPGSSPRSSKAVVPVGNYRLEVGSAQDTFALFTAQAEAANANGLARALSAEAEAEASKVADLLEGPLDEASSATGTSERYLNLFNAIAAGNALDPKVVSQELDAALALLTRLDREGRHKEVLRLARDLSALFALLLRWLELVRTLRLALSTAQALGDRPSEAWALHELGSLHLAAGESETAAKCLHQALDIEQGLAGCGRCATRHNLDAAERDTAERDALRKASRRRRLRFVGTGAVIVLLASGGTALGVGVPLSNTSSQSTSEPTTTQRMTPPPTTTHSATTIHTPTTTHATTTTRTNTVDNIPPSLELSEPAGSLNTATPTFSGRGGTARGDLATITLTVWTADPTQVEQLPIQLDASGQFSATPQTPLPPGSYTAVVTQGDRSGNIGRSDHVNFTIDLTSPIVTFTSPKDGGIADVMATFEGTAGTLSGDEPTITVKVYNLANPSAPPVEVLPATAVDGSWTARSTTPLDGGFRYQAVVSQSDQAGNTGYGKVSFVTPTQ